MVPFVTVIVPVRNEERCLDATLRALLAQRYPPDRFEVLVIDVQSDDGTCDIVRRWQAQFEHVQLLSNPRRLSSAARNIGVSHARGDYLLVVDGHCELRNRDYLQSLVSVFERHGVESVGRPQPLEVAGASPLHYLACGVGRPSRECEPGHRHGKSGFMGRSALN